MLYKVYDSQKWFSYFISFELVDILNYRDLYYALFGSIISLF